MKITTDNTPISLERYNRVVTGLNTQLRIATECNASLQAKLEDANEFINARAKLITDAHAFRIGQLDLITNIVQGCDRGDCDAFDSTAAAVVRKLVCEARALRVENLKLKMKLHAPQTKKRASK